MASRIDRIYTIEEVRIYTLTVHSDPIESESQILGKLEKLKDSLILTNEIAHTATVGPNDIPNGNGGMFKHSAKLNQSVRVIKKS